jgi:sugar-specific transcriptional regulator TrmB
MVNMSISEASLKELREIGLTEYEINALLALIDGGKMSASEISSRSKVPYSRIYEVLSRLEDREFIQIFKGRPTKYLSKSPKEIVSLVQLEWQKKIDGFGKYIIEELQPRYEKETPLSTRDVWLLNGRSAIFAKALDILEGTREELLISLPSLDVNVPELKSLVEQALSVKAKVKILTERVPHAMRALIPDSYEVRTRERVFGAGIVSDKRHTLIMLSESDNDEEFLGIYSSHVVFADMASAYFHSLWRDSTQL